MSANAIMTRIRGFDQQQFGKLASPSDLEVVGCSCDRDDRRCAVYTRLTFPRFGLPQQFVGASPPLAGRGEALRSAGTRRPHRSVGGRSCCYAQGRRPAASGRADWPRPGQKEGAETGHRCNGSPTSRPRCRSTAAIPPNGSAWARCGQKARRRPAGSTPAPRSGRRARHRPAVPGTGGKWRGAERRPPKEQ
jgi:hypothetical protein